MGLMVRWKYKLDMCRLELLLLPFARSIICCEGHNVAEHASVDLPSPLIATSIVPELLPG